MTSGPPFRPQPAKPRPRPPAAGRRRRSPWDVLRSIGVGGFAPGLEQPRCHQRRRSAAALPSGGRSPPAAGRRRRSPWNVLCSIGARRARGLEQPRCHQGRRSGARLASGGRGLPRRAGAAGRHHCLLPLLSVDGWCRRSQERAPACRGPARDRPEGEPTGTRNLPRPPFCAPGPDLPRPSALLGRGRPCGPGLQHRGEGGGDHRGPGAGPGGVGRKDLAIAARAGDPWNRPTIWRVTWFSRPPSAITPAA